MQLGVFIPIGNNGWIISTTSPQYMPSFDLNRTIVEKAERFGFDFALSMIKLHGFGGPCGYWDHNLESFTLMAGLAAVTTRIQLFATCAVLTMPPPIAARMAVTIDSISHGRFGVNIISGWQRPNIPRWALARRRALRATLRVLRRVRDGHAGTLGERAIRLQGRFFQMDDCRLLPMPAKPIPIICAAQSDAGTRFAAEYADYNFCASFGVNRADRVAPSVARLVKATAETGRNCGALVLTMIIADETDAAAQAKWEHYKDGTDWRRSRGATRRPSDDPSQDPSPDQPPAHPAGSRPGCRPTRACSCGSYATVARMLDELAAVPGVQGVMLTFDDFVIGMEQFGTRILPLMRCRDVGTGGVMPTSRGRPHDGRRRGGRRVAMAARCGGVRGSCAASCPGCRSGRWRPSWLLFRAADASCSWWSASGTMTASASIRLSCWTITTSCSTTPATLRVYVSSLKFAVIVWAITLFLGFNIAYFLIFHVRSGGCARCCSCSAPSRSGPRHHPHHRLDPLPRPQRRLQPGADGPEPHRQPLEFLLFSRFRGGDHLCLPVHPADDRADRQLAVEDRPGVIEAARDAGASRWRTMADVVIPLSKTGIALGSMLVFTQVMGDYFVVKADERRAERLHRLGALDRDPGHAVPAGLGQRDGAGGLRRHHGGLHDARRRCPKGAGEVVMVGGAWPRRATGARRGPGPSTRWPRCSAPILLFLYGPMVVIYVLSFQGPNGGVTFPMVGVSLDWFQDDSRSRGRWRTSRSRSAARSCWPRSSAS